MNCFRGASNYGYDATYYRMRANRCNSYNSCYSYPYYGCGYNYPYYGGYYYDDCDDC